MQKEVLGGSLNHVVLFLDLFLHGFRKLDPVDDIDPEGQPAFGERLLHGRHRLEGKGSLGNDREIEFRFGSQVNPREAGAVRPDFQPLEMEGEDALDGFQLDFQPLEMEGEDALDGFQLFCF